MIQTMTRCRKRVARLAAVTLVALAATASAQQLPSYYPAEGFRRTGDVDAVFLEENRIVIGDLNYHLSDGVVVHAPNAYSIPKTRLRPGVTVGFKVVDGQTITEIWLLPRNYRPRR